MVKIGGETAKAGTQPQTALGGTLLVVYWAGKKPTPKKQHGHRRAVWRPISTQVLGAGPP